MTGRDPIEPAGSDGGTRRDDGPQGGFQIGGLTSEEVGILLGELRDLLAGEAPEEPEREELRGRLLMLLSTLERAPAPGSLTRRSFAALRSWSEVWVDELESGREGAAESVRTLLLVELMRLGRILGEEA